MSRGGRHGGGGGRETGKMDDDTYGLDHWLATVIVMSGSMRDGMYAVAVVSQEPTQYVYASSFYAYMPLESSQFSLCFPIIPS